MKGVELYGQVRRAVYVEGMSRREAARRFGIDPRTVAKMLARRLEARFLGLDDLLREPPAATRLILSSCACSTRASNTSGTG
jgi:hypothetical protein